MVNGGEPRLRGCIGTLEAHCLISGFKDYALTRYCCLMHPLYVDCFPLSSSLCPFLGFLKSSYEGESQWVDEKTIFMT